MDNSTKVYTKSISQIFTIIQHMASPNGTTVKKLTKELSLTRRSVSRLIRTMENEYYIPIISKREGFGGTTKYCLEKSFIDCFSSITLPAVQLSFEEAITVYLYATCESIPNEDNYSNFRLLREMFTSYRKQHITK